MSAKRAPKKPKFPRRKWALGQQERVETPKKGKGSYHRSDGKEEADEASKDWQENARRKRRG